MHIDPVYPPIQPAVQEPLFLSQTLFLQLPPHGSSQCVPNHPSLQLFRQYPLVSLQDRPTVLLQFSLHRSSHIWPKCVSKHSLKQCPVDLLQTYSLQPTPHCLSHLVPQNDSLQSKLHVALFLLHVLDWFRSAHPELHGCSQLSP